MAPNSKCRTNGLSGSLGLRRNSPHYKNVYIWAGKKNKFVSTEYLLIIR